MTDNLTPNPPFLLELQSNQAAARAALGLPGLTGGRPMMAHYNGFNPQTIPHATWTQLSVDDVYWGPAWGITNNPPGSNPALPAGCPAAWNGISHGLGTDLSGVYYTTPEDGFYAISVAVVLGSLAQGDLTAVGVSFFNGPPPYPAGPAGPAGFDQLAVPAANNGGSATLQWAQVSRAVGGGVSIAPMVYAAPAGGGGSTVSGAIFEVVETGKRG